MPSAPASISQRAETVTIAARDGKLANWVNITPPEGGLVGILAQIGALVGAH